MERQAGTGRRRGVVLLLATLLLVAGCGSGDDSADDAAGGRTEAVDPAAPAASVASTPDGPDEVVDATEEPAETIVVSGEAPFVEREPGCLATVDAARAEDDPDGDGGDLVRRAVEGELPMPPAFDGRKPVIGQVERFDDVAAYFRKYGSVIEAEERRRAMEQLGFAGAVDVDHLFGAEVVSVMALRFASPADASAYADLHLRRACNDAVGMRGLTNVPGGVTYVREGRNPVTKAVFVVGDTEVNLTLCHCVSVDDVLAETEAWAERVVAAPSPRS